MLFSKNSILMKPPNSPCIIESDFPLIDRNKCPACGCIERSYLLRTYDDRYGFPDEFDIVSCKSCGSSYLLRYVAPFAMARLYNQYYATQYRPLLYKSITLKQRIRFFIRHSKIWKYVTAGQDLSHYIQKGDYVLDVGCGFGTNAASTQYLGAHWFGLDVDPKVIDYLRTQGLDCAQGLLEHYAKQTNKRFDKILLSQIIEHIPNPIEFLKSARKLLSPNGRIVLSCPNGRSHYQKKYLSNWIHWHVPYHITHFTPQGLEKAATQANLKIVYCHEQTPPSWFFAQRNLVHVARGEKNKTYSTKLKPVFWFICTPIIRLFDMINGKKGDALVAVLIKN